jgi:hypothetical protein
MDLTEPTPASKGFQNQTTPLAPGSGLRALRLRIPLDDPLITAAFRRLPHRRSITRKGVLSWKRVRGRVTQMWVKSSPNGDQAEVECGHIAGNDARNRIAANLLRNDSAGRAGSTSAALGGVARAGWRDGTLGNVNRSACTPSAKGAGQLQCLVRRQAVRSGHILYRSPGTSFTLFHSR